MYNDKTEHALWCWELVCPQLYLAPVVAQKSLDVKTVITHKAAILKSLHKIIQALNGKKGEQEVQALQASYQKQLAKWHDCQQKQKAKSLKL